MRLLRIQIDNFRSFRSETIEIGKYTSFVGPNGVGKSTILNALNVFFREATASTDVFTLSEDDFHARNTERPIRIALTFGNLSEEAAADFSEYVRQGELTVCAIAEWDADSKCAVVHQYGARKVMPQFAQFFAAANDRNSVARLREIYTGLRDKFPELPPPGTKEAMQTALRSFEAQRPELCQLIDSKDQFYGATRGTDRLRKYVQWVFVPAVKDATSEQEEAKKTALAALLERTVRAKVSFESELLVLRKTVEKQYRELVASKQSFLTDISSSLASRLRELAHGDASLGIEWQAEAARFVSIEEPLAQVFAEERGFRSGISRIGHGLQRVFLIALLQELAAVPDAAAPTLLLGCEEPELFQHPPQAQHLHSILEEISEGNSQVIVCTHSPHFVSGRSFENVRMVRRRHEDGSACVKWVSAHDLSDELTTALRERPSSDSKLLAMLDSSLNPTIKELFFADALIFVESQEDAAIIYAYFHLMGHETKLKRSGCHIVPVGGKSRMLQPLAIAFRLGVPAFVVFDSDSDENRENQRRMHERDNRALMHLAGLQGHAPFIADTIWAENAVVWKDEIQKTIRAEVGPAVWDQVGDQARTAAELQGIDHKNPLFVAKRLEVAWEQGIKVPSLVRLVEHVSAFAAKQRNSIQAPIVTAAS